MGRLELIVAEARHHERSGRLDPAGNQPEQIQARLVGPVDILQHGDGGPGGAQFRQERGERLMRPGTAPDQRPEFARHLLGDIEERPERPRREQRITSPPQNPGRLTALTEDRGEPAQDRRLADTRLPAQQHQPAPASRRARSRALSGSALPSRSTPFQ
jgi:hypothetical protein